MKKPNNLFPRMSVIIVLGLFSIINFQSCNTAGPEISLSSLLQDMTDRVSVSSYPSPGFTCKQFSSYDQNTVAPGEEGWFANHDASWFIRQEENNGRREFVMVDAVGPGAIVRFWMTFGNEAAYTGTLRIYFDGSDTPEIEGPVLDIISGGALVGEPLSSSVSPESNYYQRGHNLYLPIPYANHVKITYECPALDPVKHSPSVYYNISYRTYTEVTNVKSFSMKELAGLSSLVEKTQQQFTTIPDPLQTLSNAEMKEQTGRLEPGESLETILSGSEPVNKINLKIEANNLPQALRSTVIEMIFDDQQTVWAPVGDFFGTGYQIRPYKTWYTEVKEDGNMTCRWIMPFKKSAVVRITNYGDQVVEIANHQLWTRKNRWSKNSMHFGAIWHELREVESVGPGYVKGDGGHFDVNYVTLTGEGVYMGTGLTVFNTADAWWGEGDEKIWVDGESFPSFIGTGTEDYFGYAWCRPEVFSHFLIAQPDGSGNFHTGMSVNLRFYILDGIPFTNSLQFDLELWHWAKTVMNYAPMSFWYLKPGGTCNVVPDIEAVKKEVALKRQDLIKPKPIINGILEGESLRVIDMSNGDYQIQNSSDWNWSDDSQLWWIADADKAILNADFIIEEAGTYNIQLNFTKAIDYGNFRIAINGNYYPKVLVGYHDQTGKDVITQLVNLGIFKLEKGANTLKIEVDGKHRKAIPKYMVGIDYLKIKIQE